jgi:hypothetical protein
VAAPTDEQLLDLVKQALSGTLTRNAASVSIAGRSLASLSISELIALRNDLERRIRAAAGGSAAMVVRFREPA